MKPNKLKRNLIIIFSVIVLACAIILVLYNTTDIFRTKRGAFFRYFEQIPEAFEILETSDGYKTYQNTKESMPYITSGEMTITESNNIADASILNKIRLTLNGKTDNKSEKSNTRVTVNSENTELFNMTIARNKKLYGFYAPQIADGYIVVRNEKLNELADKIDFEYAENVPEQIMPLNIEKILEIKNNEKNSIAKYIRMINNQAPDTAYTKNDSEKIEIEGQTYQTTSYSLKLNSEQNSNLQISILEEMTKDSIMMNFITSKCRLLNLKQDFTDINTLNSKMKERIELLKNNPSMAGEIVITVYENWQKNIQTKIEYNNKIITLSHIQNDDDNYVILKIEDENKITTVKLEKNTDSYIVKIQNEENDIIKSAEFIYSLTGTVSENNIQNHLTIKLVDDIKRITFEYNDNISFTNDIGTLEEMQDDKVAVINDYDADYLKEFVNLVKKQINTVYINQAASIGINLDPIFLD